jgi:hypothetical protein
MNEYIAGSITGIIVSIFGHPFDTLKTLSQSKNTNVLSRKKWYRVYNGIGFPLLGSFVIHSGMFGTNDYLYKKTQNHYTSGFFTGAICSTIVTPFELYKVRAQNMLSLRINPYTGFTPTIARESIACSIYFGTYNSLRKRNTNILLAGGLSGWFSWLVTYPVDVCKTRIQSHAAKDIKGALSMGNLWKGFGYCSMRCFIANSAGFYAYEKTLEYLKCNQ